MKRSELSSLPEYFGDYIKEVEDIDLISALLKYGPEMFVKDLRTLEKIGGNTYAENKWTIKQILQHMADAERVFLYRALCFARKDETPLPSFDESLYVETSDSNRRSLNEILTEFESIRNSALTLYQGFTEEMLLKTGICYGKKLSVAAIGFVIAGHTYHHYKVIRDRYFSLVE